MAAHSDGNREARKAHGPTAAAMIGDRAPEATDPARVRRPPRQALAARGLQLFKAHENIVYASLARPRSFHQQEKVVSDSVKNLLETLKVHAAAPRAEQWKALLASRSPEQEAAEHEATLMKDLSWLLHEGYVVNYATRGFQAI